MNVRAEELCRLSAGEAAKCIAAGTLSSEELTRACLARIRERERDIGAFVYIDPEQALAEARARDREPSRGPLHGIPVGVKDIMDTADMPTGYGSDVYEGHRPFADAACVAAARAAGAVVIGKTVTTEFASLSSVNTRNPHNLAHAPGFSSSGSAAGLADFMMPLALATQTGGSIIRPAALCGVVGYKPTFGLVPVSGTKVQAHSLDTIGAMGREVADIAMLMAALTGRQSLAAAAISEIPSIGRYEPIHFEVAQPASVDALDRVAQTVGRAGACVTNRPRFPEFDDLVADHNTIMVYEAARNLAWERINRMAELSPDTQKMLARGMSISADEYDEALAMAEHARASLDAFFGDHDAILLPAAPGEAPLYEVVSPMDSVFNRPWTLLGVPAITIPAGRGPNGLPIGVQLIGRIRQDAKLIAIAAMTEATLRASCE
jgi:Asp-tRNA(Asn)/Glu-tRNA(Gln) amidotransferase A subunit family amidase